jgi:D-alanyl-lipoteichoic acid acyltransferase DltB (MBOAT superfamily)
MRFNSLDFLVFFVVVYSLYLLVQKRHRLQNLLLLTASYVFYAYWDWRFLSLIAISTLTDFFVGCSLVRDNEAPPGESRRKLLLTCSLVINLGILGVFKYFNFFADSLVSILRLSGIQASPVSLRFLLPIGISFYTLQTMSYTIDIYRGRLQPTSRLLDFAVFVSFFPQLVAGPIERAKNMLPQIESPRHITTEQLNTGFFLVLWGFFKKLFVADNVGVIADQVFNNYVDFAGVDVLIGVLAFSVQVYGDFSGYSDIARGISRLLGFELMVNFRLPQFSLNPTDFWNRWHISLSQWLRDYIFYPVRRALLRRNRSKKAVSLVLPPMITMLVSGLWHGPDWTFVLWGGFHGLLLIAYQLLERRRLHGDPWTGDRSLLRVGTKMALMSVLIQIGWVIFRAKSLHQVGYMLSHVSLASSEFSAMLFARLVVFALPLLLIQVYQYLKGDLLILAKLPGLLRICIYSLLLLGLFLFGARQSLEFIYFQF